MVPYCKWIWCIVLCKRRPSSMCWKGLCLAWTSLRIDWITRSRLNGWSAACQPQQLVWILLELSVSLGNDMLCHYNILTLVLCLCSPWCLCTILLKQISFAQLGVAFQISSLVNWSVVSMIFIGVLLGKIPMLMKICSNRFWKKMPFSEPWSNSSPRTDDPVVGFHRVFPFHGWRRGAISKPMILRISNSLQSSLWGLGAPFLVPLGSRYDVFMFGYLFGGNTTYGRSVN